VAQLTEAEIFTRLALAMVAGAALGFERERAYKPAGLRTYMLVAEGAALFMLAALLISQQVAASGEFSDPARIASTVIQGIGFIAAGVIITTGREIFGLTTAAGIWVTTAVGLLIGAGFFVLAIGATFVTIVALVGLRALEVKLGHAEQHAPPEDES
jgi:putative Mg2+ transporter-C (MgtC) family protein